MTKYFLFFITSCTLLFAEPIENDLEHQNGKQSRQIFLLKDILKKVKKYKQLKENEIQNLQKELEETKKAFQEYKIHSKKEMTELKSSLASTEKALFESKHKLTELQNIIQNLTKETPESYSEESIEEEFIEINNNISNAKLLTSIPEEIAPQTPSIPVDFSWIEIEVENNVNIYDLAQEYYGDKKEYKTIYAINKQVIGRDLKLQNGMQLMIPITEKFKEPSLSLY